MKCRCILLEGNWKMENDKTIKLRYTEFVAMQADAIKLKTKCDMYEEENEGFGLSRIKLKNSIYETKTFDTLRDRCFNPYYSDLAFREDRLLTFNTAQDNNLYLYTSNELIKETIERCNSEIESKSADFNDKLKNAFDKIKQAEDVIEELKDKLNQKDKELNQKDIELEDWELTWRKSTVLFKRGPNA